MNNSVFDSVHYFITGTPKALDEDETEFLDTLELVIILYGSDIILYK